VSKPISPAQGFIQIPIFTNWIRAIILISHDKLKPWHELHQPKYP
jgi:hypothetical protein